MKKALLFLILFLSSEICSEIIEIQHFKEIQSYLSSDTVVVLDIDDTLLIPVQMMGCDEWFQCRLRFHQKEGFTAFESFEKSLSEWEALRYLTKMEVVEPGTQEHVGKIQDMGYRVMGLTTQGLALATCTQKQLLDNQIDLKRSAPSQEDHYFLIDGHGVLYRKGILFTSGTHKGRALFKFFESTGYCPKRIVFINDKRSHLQSIEETANEKGIEFFGLRYAYSDAKKAAFDEKIADYQFSHSTFTHLISDEEAKKIIEP